MVYKHLNEQLSKHRQELFRLQKIETMLSSLEEELSDFEEKTRAARVMLDKADKDYKKISGKSVSSILYSVLGRLEEKTEEERREALEAQLRYTQCKEDLDDIQVQMAELEAEKLQYKDSQANYNRLYKEKLRILMSGNNSIAQQVMELIDSIEYSKSNQREIEEAVNAGRAALRSINATLDSLDSAEGWGMWDILGGGMITSMAKHSHIDDANDAARHTQSLLRRFRTELADVQISENIRVEISGFAKFADFFLDGFFADWFVQSRINDTQERVQSVERQVQEVMEMLDELHKAEVKSRQGMSARLEQLVVDA